MSRPATKDLIDDYPLERFETLIPGWELFKPEMSKAKWRASRKDGTIFFNGQTVQAVVIKALLWDQERK